VGAAVATGFGVALLYVIPYAIAELYLTGHSMKPPWFDLVAEVLLFVVAGGAALGVGLVVWRATARTGS
jgi:hypothetical protein